MTAPITINGHELGPDDASTLGLALRMLWLEIYRNHPEDPHRARAARLLALAGGNGEPEPIPSRESRRLLHLELCAHAQGLPEPEALAVRRAAAAIAGDGLCPGDPLLRIGCPACGVTLQIMIGDDPGEIGVLTSWRAR